MARVRRICAELPEVTEGTQMGSVVWRVGKRSFFMLYDYGKGLTAQFWVGIERQGPLEMDPRLEDLEVHGTQGLDGSRSRGSRSLARSECARAA